MLREILELAEGFKDCGYGDGRGSNASRSRDGYPRVDGNDSFDDMNKQVLAWLDIDAMSLTTAQKDPNAADLFTDKARQTTKSIFSSLLTWIRKASTFNVK